MKKILTIFAAAVAALSLASCNKDDSVYENNTAMGNEIAIEAMMAEDAQTRAADAKYATTANINSFTLGIYAGDDEVALSQFDKPTAPATVWSDGNTYYWAKDKTYKFYGVARSIGDNAVAHNSNYISKDGIKFTNREITPGEDLIVAYADGKQGTTQVTKLTFNHALARVRVAASFSATSGTKIQAKFVKWELKNVATTGSVTIDGSTVKTNDIAWTPASTKVAVSDDQASTSTSAYLDGDYRIVTGDKVADNQENTNKRWMNVIPNASVYADELVATVEFYTAEGNLIATRKLHAKVNGQSLTPKVPALTYAEGWAGYKSGKAYTYKIDIKDDGGNSTDPTDDPNNLDKYKIELKTIEVAEWVPATGGTAKFE